MEIITHPFTLGLLLGLVIAAVIGINGWLKRRSLVKDNQLLKEHLQVQMTINNRGNQETLQELEQLKRQNENLRVSLAVLKNRPDKSELKTLYLYDRAIHMMYEKAPGFAPAWESFIKEAEAEMEKTNTGLMAWARRVIHPSLTPGSSHPTQPEEDISFIQQEEKSEQES